MTGSRKRGSFYVIASEISDLKTAKRYYMY